MTRIFQALLALGLLFAGSARAEDAVPEQMPFDIPYGTPITLDHARAVADAARAEAEKHHWKLVIAVVDPSGTLVFFEKMDGAQTASVAIAEAKARASAGFRRPTKVFQEGIESGKLFFLAVPGVIGAEGGFPLMAEGKLIGAIGCSGATSVQDGVACKAGLDK
ncbi:MAG TPA: heme-binding protein [Stellaceae bacterium]|nr:heme-binding protein [Stellaceae bacterium]